MVNDSRLLHGTLTFGATGTPSDASGQTTNTIIEQQDGDSEDVAYVLSGDVIGGETLPGPWHITGTMIQDFDAAAGTSIQEWSYKNRGTWQPFTFTPNDVTTAPTVTGEVYVKFLGLGGDVKVRITRDFDWTVRGDADNPEPSFGAWDGVAVAAAPAKSTAAASSSSS